MSSKLCFSSFQIQSSCQSKLTTTSGMTIMGPLLLSANGLLHPFTRNLEAGKWESVAGNKRLELKQFLSIGEQLQEGTEFCWFAAVSSDSKTVNGKCFFNRWVKNSGNVSEVRSLKSLVTVSVKTHKITFVPHTELLRSDLKCCQSCCKYPDGKY